MTYPMLRIFRVGWGSAIQRPCPMTRALRWLHGRATPGNPGSASDRCWARGRAIISIPDYQRALILEAALSGWKHPISSIRSAIALPLDHRSPCHMVNNIRRYAREPYAWALTFHSERSAWLPNNL